MQKMIKIYIITIIISMGGITVSTAAVYFITKPDGKYSGNVQRPCIIDGYTLTGVCPDNKTPLYFCPLDSSYYRMCKCDDDIYQFDGANCLDGKSLGGKTCETKFETCECNLTAYPYNKTNCFAPKILSGNSCDNTHFQTCSCPAEYNKICPSPLIGADTKDCGGRYTNCKCPDNYVSCDYGGVGTACNDGSGEKFLSCKKQTCEEGYLDADNYWCNGALRCVFKQ